MPIQSTVAPEVRWALDEIARIEAAHDVMPLAMYARMRDLAAGRIKPKIITTHVYPPIPIRSCDWCAYYDGEEDERMDVGYGQTEAEAIADLVTNYPRAGE